MSLEAFQRAFADLIASPELCVSMIADPEPVLARYPLTERERRRLVSVVGQSGMSVNCTLYRLNRLTPLSRLLPLTCLVLGDDLAHEAPRFWAWHAGRGLHFQEEIDRFAEFLRQRIGAGALDNPFLEEVLDFELAVNALRFLPQRQIQIERTAGPAGDDGHGRPLRLHPLVRVVPFRHDPSTLLRLWTKRQPPPYDLAEGEFYLVLVASGTELQSHQIAARLGRLLLQIEAGDASPLSPEESTALVAAGLVVLTA